MTGFASEAALRSAGFDGFLSVATLRASRLAEVPALPGVYLVLRAPAPPRFLARSRAGFHKGRDPTLPLEALRRRWIPGARVLYIGKAGGTSPGSTLRARLRAYLRHGKGRRAGHWGGRAIWQLADAEALRVAWQARPRAEPRQVEQTLLREFERRYSTLPFANRCR